MYCFGSEHFEYRDKNHTCFVGLNDLDSFQVKAVVRLIMPSANARPGPQIGQALGPLGLNMAEVIHLPIRIL